MADVAGTDVFRFAPCAGPCCKPCDDLWTCLFGFEAEDVPATIDLTLPNSWGNVGGANDCGACETLNNAVFTLNFNVLQTAPARVSYRYRDWNFCTHRFNSIDYPILLELVVRLRCNLLGCFIECHVNLLSPATGVIGQLSHYDGYVPAATTASSYFTVSGHEHFIVGSPRVCEFDPTDPVFVELG